MLYIWSAKGIFPHMYTGGRTVFFHASVFSIILYITIAPLYLIVSSAFIDSSSAILIAYITHVILNIFGLEIVISILSGYRYALLSIYSSIISLIMTSSCIFFIFEKTSTESSNVLFVLLGLSMLSFVISIIISFSIRYFYYRLYLATGSDPIGDVFVKIEQENKDMEKEVENKLFKKI
jgi:hypothetical protein